MIGFAQPWFLLLLPLAPAAAWWHLRRRRPALRFPDLSLMAGLPVGRATRARWGAALLHGFLLAAVVLAAANPRTPDLQTRMPVDGIAIVLALDVSGSMGDEFAPTQGGTKSSRLDAAKQAFRLFVAGGRAPDGETLTGRPNDQMALVTFAIVPRTACPLTLNHTVLLKVLDEQVVREGVDSGTNIGDALAEALIRLEAAGNRRKVVVLLSDGENNKSGADSLVPVQTADLAKKLGVVIHTIDCGGEGSAGDPDSVKQRAEGRAVMEEVAEATGGRAFVAESGTDLKAVLKSIDDFERDPVISYRYRRYHDFGPWCGIAAVALLGVLSVLERTRWRTLT